MIKFENKKGVTLIMLIITIIVLLIILGVSITLSLDTIDQTIDTQDLGEMFIVQHAVQQRYKEYKETGEDEKILVGAKIEDTNEYIISSNQKLSEVLPDGDYYVAVSGSDERLYYIDKGKPKEISVYKNTITKSNGWNGNDTPLVTDVGLMLDSTAECREIKSKDNIMINSLMALGITGHGVSSSEFKVNYEDGSVQKIGSSAHQIQGYTNNTTGETTSSLIEIDE